MITPPDSSLSSTTSKLYGSRDAELAHLPILGHCMKNQVILSVLCKLDALFWLQKMFQFFFRDFKVFTTTQKVNTIKNTTVFFSFEKLRLGNTTRKRRHKTRLLV